MSALPSLDRRASASEADDLRVHRQVLRLGGRCPACAERLDSGAALRGEACPRCGAPTEAPHAAVTLPDELALRLRRRQLAIVAGVAGAQLLLGWFPLLGSAAVIVAAGLHRFLVLEPASAHLAPRRRLLTRWTTRLLVGAWLAGTLVVTELLTLLHVGSGPAKAALAAAQLGGLAWATDRYVGFQLRREREGRPTAAWEWLLVVGALLGLGGAVAGFVLAVLYVAERLGPWLGGAA